MSDESFCSYNNIVVFCHHDGGPHDCQFCDKPCDDALWYALLCDAIERGKEDSETQPAS